MSYRENIAANIITTLENTKNSSSNTVRLGKITREPVVIADLSRESFPCLFVESSNEIREDVSNTMRQGTIEYILNLFVLGDFRDKQRNDLIEMIEEALTVDRKRNGNAHDTRLLEIQVIESGEAKPYASMRLIFAIDYCYTTGDS